MHYKVYVDVIAKFSNGMVEPVSITWPDGKVYTIDWITDAKYGPAKSGGYGMIYSVRISGANTRIYYDSTDQVWWMDSKKMKL